MTNVLELLMQAPDNPVCTCSNTVNVFTEATVSLFVQGRTASHMLHIRLV